MAKRDDAEAQFQIGLLNEQGLGEPQNIDQAARLFYKAAKQGHWRALARLTNLAKQGIAIAQFFVGENHIAGFADNRDDRKAQIWFERAALQGLAEAQVQLGRTYLPPSSAGGAVTDFFVRLFGKLHGVKRDVALAMHWFQAAADRGSADGRFQLGLLHLLGHYVEQDVEAGFRLMEEAAAMGLGHAQIPLAVIYSEGEYGDPDPKRATHWFNQAANQIDKEFEAETLVCMGIACREGWGAAPNKLLAYKWFKLAEYKDKHCFYTKFGPIIRDLKKTMTKSEIGAAISLIEEAHREEQSSL
jgi:TPR repeat protein